MKKIIMTLLAIISITAVNAANKYDNPDTLFVSRDGTCEFRNISDAIEVCRAYMTYHKVIFVKKGVYKEKIIVPTWLTNIEICGEDRENTIITWDDHANIVDPHLGRKLTTFRTYTVLVQGSNITFKNITIDNNAARLGQAVALHTEGDKCAFINCKLLGNQDTVFTGRAGARQYFKNCYIEGTTDFIFGPSTVWFENCDIVNKNDSYVTAASTPADQAYGYIFNNCRVKCLEGQDAINSNRNNPITKCCLGRPWRPYAYTLFMNCELGGHIVAAGWNNWGNKENEKTARYMEYNNHGKGAAIEGRAAWAKQLTKKEASAITLEAVFGGDISWLPKE
ncbi:MAG: pectin esterase [Prevotella sp.]|nr:pectin esterase [Prevotella sp.]